MYVIQFGYGLKYHLSDDQVNAVCGMHEGGFCSSVRVSDIAWAKIKISLRCKRCNDENEKAKHVEYLKARREKSKLNPRPSRAKAKETKAAGLAPVADSELNGMTPGRMFWVADLRPWKEGG